MQIRGLVVDLGGLRLLSPDTYRYFRKMNYHSSRIRVSISGRESSLSVRRIWTGTMTCLRMRTGQIIQIHRLIDSWSGRPIACTRYWSLPRPAPLHLLCRLEANVRMGRAGARALAALALSGGLSGRRSEAATLMRRHRGWRSALLARAAAAGTGSGTALAELREGGVGPARIADSLTP